MWGADRALPAAGPRRSSSVGCLARAGVSIRGAARDETLESSDGMLLARTTRLARPLIAALRCHSRQRGDVSLRGSSGLTLGGSAKARSSMSKLMSLEPAFY